WAFADFKTEIDTLAGARWIYFTVASTSVD
ncbi:MAG: hypothetical protein QOG12_204, partial [Verrucomicrobiota bacterium]